MSTADDAREPRGRVPAGRYRNPHGAIPADRNLPLRYSHARPQPITSP